MWRPCFECESSIASPLCTYCHAVDGRTTPVGFCWSLRSNVCSPLWILGSTISYWHWSIANEIFPPVMIVQDISNRTMTSWFCSICSIPSRTSFCTASVVDAFVTSCVECFNGWPVPWSISVVRSGVVIVKCDAEIRHAANVSSLTRRKSVDKKVPTAPITSVNLVYIWTSNGRAARCEEIVVIFNGTLHHDLWPRQPIVVAMFPKNACKRIDPLNWWDINRWRRRVISRGPVKAFRWNCTIRRETAALQMQIKIKLTFVDDKDHRRAECVDVILYAQCCSFIIETINRPVYSQGSIDWSKTNDEAGKGTWRFTFACGT